MKHKIDWKTYKKLFDFLTEIGYSFYKSYEILNELEKQMDFYVIKRNELKKTISDFLDEFYVDEYNSEEDLEKIVKTFITILNKNKGK